MPGPVFILGVGPGLGLSLARAFAGRGHPLALFARNAAALADHAAGFPGAQAHALDLRDPGAVAPAIEAALAALGTPEALVYNAAGVSAGPAMALSPAAFHADLATSASSAFAAARAVHPAMTAAGGGSLLFTGGGLALDPAFGAGVASLTAGKSALRGLVHALAGELAPEGLHVGTVTVAGRIEPGGAFDPDRIAQAFLELHDQPRSAWQVEVILRG